MSTQSGNVYAVSPAMVSGDGTALRASFANPHNFTLHWVAIVIAAGLVFLVNGVAGLIPILAGVFTFLDSWYAGIWKEKRGRGFLNFSPASWGIAMMGLLMVGYPAYALNRQKMKTQPGHAVFWYLTHVFGGLALVLFFVALARVAS